MIARDPQACADGSYDLVVVGGGIHGAMLTLEAARRGLQVLLLERDDFGGATSWNSLRILHGGLRYLQSLDLRRYRESVAERRWFLRHFPDLVEPLACLMPLYGNGLRRPAVFSAALALDARLSRRRNEGVAPDRHLERGRVLEAAETVALYPAINSSGLQGAALWNDAYMPHSPRVLIEVLRWAASAGAQMLNYCEAKELALDDGAVTGVTAIDRRTGRSCRFRARRVANCAGPWSREVAAAFDRDRTELFRPVVALNLLLDCAAPSNLALAVSPPEQKRSYFLVPWRNRLLAGTFYTADQGGQLPIPGSDLVSEFAHDLHAAVPGLGLGDASVLRVFAGRLPAAEGADDTPSGTAVVVDHARDGGPSGLVSAVGVKYTTARALAKATLTRLFREDLPALGAHPRPAAAIWPSGDQIDAGDDRSDARGRVRALAAEESVVRLEDLTLRRTDLAVDPRHNRAAVERLSTWLDLDEVEA